MYVICIESDLRFILEEKMNKKKTLQFSALIVVLSLLLTGTLAFIDLTQHKTNEASTQLTMMDVALVEDFDPDDFVNWMVPQAGEPAKKKEIHVANIGLRDQSAAPAWIRLQFKEYAEMGDSQLFHTDTRYAIDTTGQFIRRAKTSAAETPTEGKALFAGDTLAQKYFDLDPTRLPEDWQTMFDDQTLAPEGYWYIPTNSKDVNGQYGRYLLLRAESSIAMNSLLPDSPNYRNEKATDTSASANHHEGVTEECDYPTYTWQNTNVTAPIHDYVQWLMNDARFDVIPTWSAYDPTNYTEAMWIVAENDPEGYAYWNEALAPEEKTENIMNAMQLIEQPTGEFYYALHIEMEAYSLEDIPSDWPAQLVSTVAPPAVQSDKIILAGGYRIDGGGIGTPTAPTPNVNAKFDDEITRMGFAAGTVIKKWKVSGNHDSAEHAYFNTANELIVPFFEKGIDWYDPTKGGTVTVPSDMNTPYTPPANANYTYLTVTAISEDGVRKSINVRIIPWLPVPNMDDASGNRLMVAQYFVPGSENLDKVRVNDSMTMTDANVYSGSNLEREMKWVRDNRLTAAAKGKILGVTLTQEAQWSGDVTNAPNTGTSVVKTTGVTDDDRRLFPLSYRELRDSGAWQTTGLTGTYAYINYNKMRYPNNGPWWLRSPGRTAGYAGLGGAEGNVNAGSGVTYAFGLRAVCWVLNP
jgi:hypothetical protein